MDELVADLCIILGYIHMRGANGVIHNKLSTITTHGLTLLGNAKTIMFKSVLSAYLNPETMEYSFLGILGNDKHGWLRAEPTGDVRGYNIRLWVSTEFPTWYPACPTMS